MAARGVLISCAMVYWGAHYERFQRDVYLLRSGGRYSALEWEAYQRKGTFILVPPTSLFYLTWQNHRRPVQWSHPRSPLRCLAPAVSLATTEKLRALEVQSNNHLNETESPMEEIINMFISYEPFLVLFGMTDLETIADFRQFLRLQLQ